MFIYEALSNHQKEIIDGEVRKGLEKMVLSNGGFSYSDKQFTSVIYDLVISNKLIYKLLGDNSPTYFGLKETVIKIRACKIAYELEKSRPSLETVREYIELCKLLLITPSTEALFSNEYTEKMICAFRYRFKHYIENKKTEKIYKEIVDNYDLNDYTISSNIKSFECLTQSFYNSKEESPVYVTAN